MSSQEAYELLLHILFGEFLQENPGSVSKLHRQVIICLDEGIEVPTFMIRHLLERLEAPVRDKNRKEIETLDAIHLGMKYEASNPDLPGVAFRRAKPISFKMACEQYHERILKLDKSVLTHSMRKFRQMDAEKFWEHMKKRRSRLRRT